MNSAGADKSPDTHGNVPFYRWTVARRMGSYRAVCDTCGDELVTESVTDARQYTRAHRGRGHRAAVYEQSVVDSTEQSGPAGANGTTADGETLEGESGR